MCKVVLRKINCEAYDLSKPVFDEMFEALEHEKKALIKISDGLDSMAALYEETGQTLDAAQAVSMKHYDPASSYRGDDSFRVSELAGNIRASGRS